MKLSLLCTISLVFLARYLSAQNIGLDPHKMAEELHNKSYEKEQTMWLIMGKLEQVDSLQAFQFLNQLAEEGKNGGLHFKARLNCLRARNLYYRNIYYQFYPNRKPVNQNLIRNEIVSLLSSAMDMAYKSEDDYLIAYVSYLYATIINLSGDVGVAVMYAKNGIDLYEQLSYPLRPGHYQFLAEILFKVREYEESIRYARKAVLAWQKSGNENSPFTVNRLTVNCLNTAALGYHRQQKYDSAFVFYAQALQLARQNNDTLWTGIVLGNVGQIFYTQGKYDSAYSLFQQDYQSSKAAGYYDNAANSLQWAARTSLAQGKNEAALSQVREAFQLLKLWPDAGYLRNTAYTATQIFRKIGAYDSAFYYNTLYTSIHDSLEKVVATSSLAITKSRLNDERSRYKIQQMNQEKRSELLLRNSIIAAIIVFSAIAILLINRQRLKEKLKTERAEGEKLRMEQEIANAREQMNLFTEHIIEKTNLIEKLQQQAKDRQDSSEHQAIIAELTRQTILTEEEWLTFKTLFEKTYPGFFFSLKHKFPDITLAEQRMAGLTHLRLTTKQIASMLGISADSVHKTKQRLRQRLQIPANSSLEEILASL